MSFKGDYSILNRDFPSYLAAYRARAFQTAAWMEESVGQLWRVPEFPTRYSKNLCHLSPTGDQYLRSKSNIGGVFDSGGLLFFQV
jgi:hypothetical protein